MMGSLGAVWGLVGVVAILVGAIVRLTPYMWQLRDESLTLLHWGVMVAWIVFMIFTEGYRGFQLRFAPRVAARARYLRANPRRSWVLFAPLFCIGFFHIVRRRMIAIYVLHVAIVLMVLAVRLVPQPWRGIIDVGVVVGIAWGLVCIVAFGYAALVHEDYRHSPEVPASHA